MQISTQVHLLKSAAIYSLCILVMRTRSYYGQDIQIKFLLLLQHAGHTRKALSVR